MPARIVIKDESGIYWFEFIASNGEIILRSEKYSSLFMCKEEAKLLLLNALRYDRYQVTTIPNGPSYFTITDDEGKILATSDFFWSVNSRNYAMSIIRREYISATIVMGD